MSDDFKPGPVSFSRKLFCVAMTFAWPQRVARAAAVELKREGDQKTEAEMLRRLKLVRGSFAQSLLWIAATGLVGFGLGRALWHQFGENNVAVLALATAGGLVLFGATMGVQGWDIQSFKGNTLPERINQWIFRSLTLLGTLLAVISGSWAIGP